MAFAHSRQAGPGIAYEVPTEIQRRLFSTLGIDYMEGSVNALPVRSSKLMLRPTGSNTRNTQTLEIVGQATLGKAKDGDTITTAGSRGCKIEVFGEIHYDPQLDNKITKFDLAGLGQAWGNKMEYTSREIQKDKSLWHYGVYCELVTESKPCDLVPPYNLLHYGGGMKYFGGK